MAPPLKTVTWLDQVQVEPQKGFGLCVRRVAPPLTVCYRKQPPKLAVRDHGKGQEGNTPGIAQKDMSENLPIYFSYRSLSTVSIESPPIGPPIALFSLGN